MLKDSIYQSIKFSLDYLIDFSRKHYLMTTKKLNNIIKVLIILFNWVKK
jgi:hypothetical protein